MSETYRLMQEERLPKKRIALDILLSSCGFLETDLSRIGPLLRNHSLDPYRTLFTRVSYTLGERSEDIGLGYEKDGDLRPSYSSARLRSLPFEVGHVDGERRAGLANLNVEFQEGTNTKHITVNNVRGIRFKGITMSERGYAIELPFIIIDGVPSKLSYEGAFAREIMNYLGKLRGHLHFKLAVGVQKAVSGDPEYHKERAHERLNKMMSDGFFWFIEFDKPLRDLVVSP